MTDKKPKLWLERDQVHAIFAVALVRRKRDFLIYVLMAYGLRVSEIVGSRRYHLPGIQSGDLREDNLWVLRKGRSTRQQYPLPPDVVKEVAEYARQVRVKPEQRIFPITPYWAECLLHKDAKAAGIIDWQLVGPHRLRAFFATDLDDQGVSAFTIRDFMDHVNITTTNRYVGRKRPARLGAILQKAPPLVIFTRDPNGTVGTQAKTVPN